MIEHVEVCGSPYGLYAAVPVVAVWLHNLFSFRSQVGRVRPKLAGRKTLNGSTDDTRGCRLCAIEAQLQGWALHRVSER